MQEEDVFALCSFDSFVVNNPGMSASARVGTIEACRRARLSAAGQVAALDVSVGAHVDASAIVLACASQ